MRITSHMTWWVFLAMLPESIVLHFLDALPTRRGSSHPPHRSPGSRLATALTNRTRHRWGHLISRSQRRSSSRLSARKLPRGAVSLHGKSLRCEEAGQEGATRGQAACRLPTESPRLSALSVVLAEAPPRHNTCKKCAYPQEVIYFKEWTHTIMET